jgi:hypothetical protein
MFPVVSRGRTALRIMHFLAVEDQPSKTATKEKTGPSGDQQAA